MVKAPPSSCCRGSTTLRKALWVKAGFMTSSDLHKAAGVWSNTLSVNGLCICRKTLARTNVSWEYINLIEMGAAATTPIPRILPTMQLGYRLYQLRVWPSDRWDLYWSKMCCVYLAFTGRRWCYCVCITSGQVEPYYQIGVWIMYELNGLSPDVTICS